MNQSRTGKSLSELLIYLSINPQYDNRLFNDLRVQYKKITRGEHVKTMKGLDTVESLSAEASANLSANRTHLISITVKWYQSDCWADVGLIQGFLCANLGKIFLLL